MNYPPRNPITLPPDPLADLTAELVRLSDLAGDLAAARVRLTLDAAPDTPAPARLPRASRLAALWGRLTGRARPPVLDTPAPASRHPWPT